MSEQEANNKPTPNDPSAETPHSIAARDSLRKRLASDVEEFLKKGGEIESVPINVRADPPKKPENTYGRGSI